MPNLYIFALDGVLFDNSHRQRLLVDRAILVKPFSGCSSLTR